MKEFVQEWYRDKRVQIGGSIVMSLAALACNPKDTQGVRIVPVATDVPPAAGVKISAERTLTPTASPTLVPDIPVIRDSKSDTPTATPAATGTPEATKTATVTPRTQGSDTPPVVAPTAERTPAPTATPRPTVTRTPEATPTKTAKELDSIFRQQLEAAINQYFFSVNNRNMNVDSVLSNFAQTCADFMAASGQYAHVCKDRPEIMKILQDWRGGDVYENIDYQPLRDSFLFMRAWKNSPEHNAAMINSNNKAYAVGCSVYKTGSLQNYGIVCVAVFGH